MELSVHEFDFIRRIVQRTTAIELFDDKKYLVELRLGILANREGFPSAMHLVHTLRQSADSVLEKKVVDAMTTNETLFFRDHRPFELIRQSLIPELIKRRQHHKTLRIWSAACSTGQEPYSIAMLLHQHFPELLHHWRVHILATDISSACLAYAKQGQYSQIEVNRGLPATYLVRCFSKQGTVWELKPDIRNLVRFQELNLISAWGPLPKADIILLRNALIYFSLDTRRQILTQLKEHLQPDGFLFLGRSESPHNVVPFFRRLEQERDSCFQICKNHSNKVEVLS